MDKEMDIKEKIARWQVLAELWCNTNKRVYIKDILNNYYFADILQVNDDTVFIRCFSPSDRIDQEINIYWANIIKFTEYDSQR